MVVVMQERATEEQVDAVIARLIELGMDVHRSSGATRTVLGVVGTDKVEKEMIEILDGIQPGWVVAVDGAALLTDGAKVSVRATTPATSTTPSTPGA